MEGGLTVLSRHDKVETSEAKFHVGVDLDPTIYQIHNMRVCCLRFVVGSIVCIMYTVSHLDVTRVFDRYELDN